MKTLKVLIEKVRITQRWFLPAFTFKHLHHYSGDDLTDFFPHPSLVLYSFATPPIKLKSGQQIWGKTGNKGKKCPSKRTSRPIR